ncbi:MAG: hypothetical protein QOE47_1693 [Pyrinomonadaceae bacterium]|jgi:hypothetical protein|nr:hypothetical protein [Pyrinomonadaceae bacterium]
MSEEKPRFKVTDRRLFNPDGTPRDIEREAEAATDNNATAADAAATAGTETVAARPGATSAGAPAATTTTAPASEGARREPSSSATASESRAAAPPAAATQDANATTTPAGVEEDPTAFANLVMFIASPAAAAMGMTEHPGLAPGELDLPLAKHCIDLLGTLQQKTHGHLGTQEQQILEGLLAELRMQYISLTSTQRPPARGFTGGDITGGR